MPNCLSIWIWLWWIHVHAGLASQPARWRKQVSHHIFTRLRNSNGWRGVLGRLFRTRSVMGRLWDDHFRDLGYPPKFYKGQDACSDSGSSSQWQIRSTLTKNDLKIIKNHMCFIKKCCFPEKQMIPGRGPQTKLNIDYLCVLRTCIFQSSRRAVSGQCQPI